MTDPSPEKSSKDSRSHDGITTRQKEKQAGRAARIAVSAGALMLLLAAGFFLTVYSGVYNIAATDGHTAPVEWALRTTMENSVRSHAAGLEVPGGIALDDRAYATQFYGHYSAACVTCHSAPGVKADPWMINYPPSPDLTDPAIVNRWSDEELFWIIKHGIKDTAMIALGPTHQDKDIWGVTALVRQLPGMTAEEYEAMGERFQAMQQAADERGASPSEGAGEVSQREEGE